MKKAALFWGRELSLQTGLPEKGTVEAIALLLLPESSVQIWFTAFVSTGMFRGFQALHMALVLAFLD